MLRVGRSEGEGGEREKREKGEAMVVVLNKDNLDACWSVTQTKDTYSALRNNLGSRPIWSNNTRYFPDPTVSDCVTQALFAFLMGWDHLQF